MVAPALPLPLPLLLLLLMLLAGRPPRAAAGAVHGTNAALPGIVVVERNAVRGSGEPVATAAALQRVLDTNPGTAVFLLRSYFEVVPDGNRTGITIRSNRSLVLGEGSTIWCNSTLPLPGCVAYYPSTTTQVRLP